MKHIYNWLRTFSFLTFFIFTTASMATTPFVCDGTPYVIIDSPSLLQQVESNLSVTDIGIVKEDGTNIQKEINGIAYNILDNYIYGLEYSTHKIIRLGSDQNVTYLGIPVAENGSDKEWSGIKTFIGTMDSDGRFYGLGSGYLYVVTIGINPAADTLTYHTVKLDTALAPGYTDPADITFNANDGLLYGNKNNTLYSINSITAVVNNLSLIGLEGDPLPSNSGGAWSVITSYSIHYTKLYDKNYATLPKEIMDFPSCILDKKFNQFIKGGYHVGLVTIC